MYQTDMALLEPKRLLADEGPAGVAKIAFNLARKPQIRERVLACAVCSAAMPTILALSV